MMLFLALTHLRCDFEGVLRFFLLCMVFYRHVKCYIFYSTESSSTTEVVNESWTFFQASLIVAFCLVFLFFAILKTIRRGKSTEEQNNSKFISLVPVHGAHSISTTFDWNGGEILVLVENISFRYPEHCKLITFSGSKCFSVFYFLFSRLTLSNNNLTITKCLMICGQRFMRWSCMLKFSKFECASN